MALNIKNAEAHRLATEIARERGITITEAVLEALRAAKEKGGRSPEEVAYRLQQVKAITAETSRIIRESGLDFKVEDLYDDETGLPK